VRQAPFRLSRSHRWTQMHADRMSILDCGLRIFDWVRRPYRIAAPPYRRWHWNAGMAYCEPCTGHVGAARCALTSWRPIAPLRRATRPRESRTRAMAGAPLRPRGRQSRRGSRHAAHTSAQ
jgi:hypothetical protein